MDAGAALAELVDVSGEIAEAIVLDAEGVIAATVGAERAAGFELAVRDLVAFAERTKPGRPAPLVRLDALDAAGGVFVVRGERLLAAAVTAADPSAALVVHDLRTLLRRVELPPGAGEEAGGAA